MDSLPECALTCLIGAIRNSTCALTDFACICENAQLNAALEPCIAGTCTIKESLTAQNYSYTTCQYPASDDTLTFPVVNIVGIIVAILSVALRLFNRVMVGQVGLDDYTIIAALFVAVAISGVGFPLKTHGLGQNIWSIPFPDIDECMKLFFIEEILYTISTALVKCSMLLLYLRLFPNRLLRLTTFTSLSITSAWAIGSFFAQLFSCKPISYYWKQWDNEHSGHCVDHNDLLLSHSIINIVLDVLVIILPMPVLVKLHMSLEKRVGMVLMFGVGLVVTVISILRLVETVGFNSTMNPTKDFVPVGVWSLLEIDIGIMCSCMPGIRALCKRLYAILFNKPTGYTGSGSSRSKPSHSGGNGSKESGGGSNSRNAMSPRHYSSKSKSSAGSGGSSGQFIRLTEVETADSTSDDRWPLRGGSPFPDPSTYPVLIPHPPPAVPRKDSFGSISGSTTRTLPLQGQSHNWHSQYPDSPSPTRLKPPPLTPPSREHQSVFGRPGTPTGRSGGSGYFTWLRDGDSS
ncbi:CFEM domain-containing protein [Aspergillus stella-maris]|uniref:CFEM domain-containing protein n=1 Tax=Aspergillus stella-maris TaxID=1810926 RepID=UPI003CCDFAD2